MKTFGERMRQLRKEKNVSCEWIGKHLGVQRAAVAMWERGEREPKLEMVVAIAKLFGTTPNYLLGFEEEAKIVNLKDAFCEHYSTELWDVINRLWSETENTKRIQ